MIHQNVQCITNKIPEIEVLLHEEKPDILCISEHWIANGNADAVQVEGYKLCSFYGRSNKIHGGVMILAKHNVICEDIHEIQKINIEQVFECCACKYKLNDSSYFIILCVYTSPNPGHIDDFLHCLYTCLEYLQKPGKKCNIVLCGDFNIDTLQKNKHRDNFLEILDSFNITLTIKEPTRYTSTSTKCIDNIGIYLTVKHSWESSVIFSAVSDHTAQQLRVFSVEDKHTYKQSKTTRQITSENIDTFRYYLSKEKWDTFKGNDVNSDFETFIQIITHYFEICFPTKKKL